MSAFAPEPEASRPAPGWEWRLGARLLIALGAAIGAVAGGPITLLPLAVAYAAAVVALDRFNAHHHVPAPLMAGADILLVGATQWAMANAGMGMIGVMTAAPAVAAHAWMTGRRLALEVAGACTLTALLVAGMRPAEVVGSAAVLAWTAFSVAHMGDAERRARRQSVELEDFRRDIVVTISHELRTPLTVIQGLIAILSRRWDQLPESKRLDIIDDLALNVGSLDASILHFIDAARIERGEIAIRRSDEALQDIVDDVRSKMQNVLAGYDVQVNLEAERIWADRESVARILELLLENAVRFSPLGSLILVRSRPQSDGVELAVTDRGQGIPAAQLPYVFEAFWRAEVTDTGVSRGAGLGLAVVRELAALHGGTATATSTKGRGSTFRVVLPDDRVTPPPDAAAPTRSSRARRPAAH